MIHLFIENTEVELSEKVQFAITKAYEDLDNPTNIKNDWSKTISIPFTQKNNNLFGNIYKTDRLIVSGNGTTGIYFDPTKKLDFRLQDGDNVLMIGYAKMNNIKQNNGKGIYSITLFGELGKVLSEMQNYVFDETDGDYSIDTSNYNFRLTRSQIVNRLVTSTPNLKRIHYTMNNGFVNDFDYKTTQTSRSATSQFKDILNADNIQFEARTGVSLDSIIGNGLKPLDVCEFRSWCQTPYLYVQNLFELVERKLQARTGYSFQKDSNWFNTSNPYWQNLVMILNQPSVEGKLSYQNRYIAKHNEYTSTFFSYNFTRRQTDTWSSYIRTFTDKVRFTVDSTQSGYEQLPIVESGYSVKTELDNYDYVISGLNLLLYNNSNDKGDSISDSALLKIRIKVYNGSSGSYWQDDFYVVSDVAIEYYKKIYPSRNYITIPKTVDTTSEVISGNTLNMHFWQIQLPNIYLSKFYNNTCAVEITYNFEGSHYIFEGDNQPVVYCILGRKSINNFATETYIDIKPTVKSYSTITLPMLWNNEVKPFEVMLNYCKMFGIMIDVDEINKKVIFKQRKQYFSNYTIEDWTNKVDYSKDFEIVPVIANAHYLLFNYDDIKTDLSEKYNKSVGFNIGEKQVDTGYNFDNNTTNLFSKLKNSNSYTPNRLEYSKLKNLAISYIGTQFTLIDDTDKDNKHLSTFGSFYLTQPVKLFENSSQYFMTDDSTYQKANNLYCYGANGKTTLDGTTNKNSIIGYTPLSIIRDNKICLFGKPTTSFMVGTDFTNATDIYTTYWKNYLDERYNIQNKKVTCYIKFTPFDWVNFRFNKFVKINNVLYMVNKIYNYDISVSGLTKVDLISVQNIINYTN